MEPQTQSSLTPDPSQQILPPANSQNHAKRNLIIVGAVVLIVMVIGILTALGLFNGRANNDTSTKTHAGTTSGPEQKAMVEQVLTNPADKSKVAISQTDYYSLTVGSTIYYGPILKINSTFLRMTPTAYKSQGQLVFTGNELHGPESATFFAISSITDVHKLNESSPDDLAIINFVKPQDPESSYVDLSDKIDEYLKTSQVQAFFFKDGMVLFAKASTVQGNFLSGAKHVYYMANNGQVSLTVAKPDQYASRTSNELLYWQNLKSSSQVAKAIVVYEKNNP